MRILAKDRVGTTVRGFKIIDYKRENNRTYFYIICPVCGNKKWLRSDSLNNPKVVSCGCYNKENNFIKRIDITNKRYGRLTAIKPTKNRDKYNGSVIWACKDNTDIKALEQSKKNPYSGVTYDKSRKMWKATITFKKKIYHLGRYHDFDEALKVRKNAEQALFDDFLEWYYHEFKSKKA